jgi:hypothetical protein
MGIWFRRWSTCWPSFSDNIKDCTGAPENGMGTPIKPDVKRVIPAMA